MMPQKVVCHGLTFLGVPRKIRRSSLGIGLPWDFMLRATFSELMLAVSGDVSWLPFALKTKKFFVSPVPPRISPSPIASDLQMAFEAFF